jgi:hypothetical protein
MKIENKILEFYNYNHKIHVNEIVLKLGKQDYIEI